MTSSRTTMKIYIAARFRVKLEHVARDVGYSCSCLEGSVAPKEENHFYMNELTQPYTSSTLQITMCACSKKRIIIFAG
jgi:hypothetical protein